MFHSQYTVIYPRFDDDCVDAWSVGLLDKWDKNVVLNDTYAFYSRNIPRRKDGLLLFKYFRVGDLDETEVTSNFEIKVAKSKTNDHKSVKIIQRSFKTITDYLVFVVYPLR